MRRLLTLLAFAFLVPTAQADVATATWTHPTQYVDNSPLPLANIANTRIEWGTCAPGGGFATKEGEKLVAAPATTTTVVISRFGDTCLRAFTITTLGSVSDPSGVVIRPLSEPKPKPPVLTVSNPVAYELKNGSLRVAGIVPVGTVCGAELARGYYSVPEDKVARTTNFRVKGALVAQCEVT